MRQPILFAGMKGRRVVPRKKTALVVTLAAISIAVTACTPTAVATASPMRSPTSSAASMAPYETSDTTFTLDNGAGYQLKATITLGPWLQGSDTAALDSAWHQLSGKIGMPLVSGTYRRDYTNNTYSMRLDSAHAAYLFGTITFENLSQGKDPSDFFSTSQTRYPGLPVGGLALDGQSYGNPRDEKFLFYCASKGCSWNDPVVDFGLPVFGPDGKSAPVVFVVAVPQVFDPDALVDLRHADFVFDCADAGGFGGTGGITPGSGANGNPIPTKIGW